MSITGIFLTHDIAHRVGKPPFFFSRFDFDQMRERGNTHYCFHCGGSFGFKPGEDGTPTDCAGDDYNPMEGHDDTHSDAVIGNANSFQFVRDWLYHEITGNFPYLVSVPSVW